MITSTSSEPIMQPLNLPPAGLLTLVTSIGVGCLKTPPAYDMPISDLPLNCAPPGNGIPGGGKPGVIASGSSGISMPIACAPSRPSIMPPSCPSTPPIRSPDQIKPTKPLGWTALDSLGTALRPSTLISTHTLGLSVAAGSFLAAGVSTGIIAGAGSPAIAGLSAPRPMVALQGDESAIPSLSVASYADGMLGHALLSDVTKDLHGVTTANGASASSATSFSGGSSVNWAGVAGHALPGTTPLAGTHLGLGLLAIFAQGAS